MRKLEYYQEIAGDMVERDEKLRSMQMGMDRMAQLDYQLPEALRKLEWVRRFISTSPYEALRAATRTLSTSEPRLKIEPVSVLRAIEKGLGPNSIAAKSKANEWERALLWAFSLAEGRRGILLSDILRSALQYDEIVGAVVHLPTQIKSVEAMGGNAMRYKAAMRRGPFALTMQNPQNVHIRYSDYMAEAVLMAVKKDPQEIVDFWGNQAREISEKIEDDKAPDSYILFDYCDYEARCVWAIPGDSLDAASGSRPKDAVVILGPDKNKYPFLPWVAMHGGTTLDAEPMFQRMPLLWPVWKAEQWITANVIGTLTVSEAISEMGAPKVKVSGPNPDSVESDFGEPGGRYVVPPGHDVVPMPQDGLDPALNELLNRFEGAMNTATLARILVTAESMPGESFSGFNLRIGTAVGSLMPYKKLAEGWLGEAFRVMLYWIYHTGHDLRGYGRDRKTSGNIYSIGSSDIDPDSLYLKAELVADVPTDRLQKINGAIMLSRELTYPKAKILEELGETDPEGALEEYWREQFTTAAIQGKLKLIEAQASNEIEQMAAHLAQQMIMQQMEQAQAQMEQQPAASPQGLEGLPPEMAGMPPDMMGGMGMPGVEGEGFNPGMGGIPPAMANPAANVMEQQTGLTRGGQPVTGPVSVM